MTSIPDMIQARAAQRNGQLGLAAHLAAQIARARPQAIEAWRLWAECALAGGAFTEAIGVLDQALDQAGADADARAWFLIEKAFACAQIGRNSEAFAAAEAVLPLPVSDGLLLGHLGIALLIIGAYEKALPVLEQALARNPTDSDLLNLIGDCQSIMGQAKQAEASFSEAFTRYGNLAAAYSLSRLRRWTAEDNHIDRLRAKAPGNALDAARSGYALFKEMDDLGRYEEAWAWLERGAAAARATGSWSNAQEQATIAAWETHFPVGHFAAPAAVTRDGPRRIFIIGLPRSGTTLVERILAANPEVQPLGEPQVFGLATKRLSGVKSPHMLDAEVVMAAAKLDPAAIAERYDRETRYLHAPGKRWVIDKLPHNSDYAGLIRLAFPDAVIIHVTRDPMDSLFGAYRLLFAQAHRWSYDLADLADHYANYRRLMAHWKTCLGSSLVEVALEDIITDPAGRIPQLLTEAGLPFDERSLTPHRSEGPVMSASANQVRAPINAQGVGSWRRYATELEPLRQRLQTLGFTA